MEDNTVRRSHRINKGIPPIRLIEEINLANEPSVEDLKTVEEALGRKDHIKWELAIIEEIESMKQNQVWTLVQLPKNQPLIRCKWVFKCKTDLNRAPMRYKARLIAQGYSQRYGHDHNEIFAPVLHHDTFRIILIIAAQQGLPVKHYDIECAFLNGNIEHDIYMHQPEYTKQEGDTRVCMLERSIYGLKQGAHEWYKRWNGILTDGGFKRSNNDHCLYIFKEGKERLYAGVHVDDIAVTATRNSLFDYFETIVSKSVKIKSL